MERAIPSVQRKRRGARRLRGTPVPVTELTSTLDPALLKRPELPSRQAAAGPANFFLYYIFFSIFRIRILLMLITELGHFFIRRMR
jgi:hypothetical protein